MKERIVVKVGTSTLTYSDGATNLKAFDRLAYVLSDLHNLGYEVILVSSGAIAIGMNKLKLEKRPEAIRMLQASAAVGQSQIMFYYDKFFNEYDKTVAQILLNAEDIENPEKTDNLIGTFNSLLSMGVIPVVNENDSVSYTEIESKERLFGDNDKLSAVVAVLTGADKLFILSDIDGFFEADPRLHPGAKLIDEITVIDESVYRLAGGSGSRRGTGGMRTKLEAAELAMLQGIDTIVLNGSEPGNILNFLNGKKLGTIFKGSKFGGSRF